MIAVVVGNGSNKAKESPFFGDAGKLVLPRGSGTTLGRVGKAPIGHWSQGAAFSADGRTILSATWRRRTFRSLSGAMQRAAQVARLTMGRCLAYRAERNGPIDCATCHH
jgi:hypothetical protein